MMMIFWFFNHHVWLLSFWSFYVRKKKHILQIEKNTLYEWFAENMFLIPLHCSVYSKEHIQLVGFLILISKYMNFRKICRHSVELYAKLNRTHGQDWSFPKQGAIILLKHKIISILLEILKILSVLKNTIIKMGANFMSNVAGIIEHFCHIDS